MAFGLSIMRYFSEQSTTNKTMKKIIFKSLCFLLFVAFVASCSSEDNDMQRDTSNAQAEATVLRGRLGVERNGIAVLTADKVMLIKKLEAAALKGGDKISLTNIEIVRKTATNDGRVTLYMIVGTDDEGVSVGMPVAHKRDGFYFDPIAGGGNDGGTTTVVCRGCATGCNLEFLLVQGKKLPYCNENGCGVYCTKKEIPD